jgi:HNH endonuclease
MMDKRLQERSSMKPIAHFEQRYLVGEDGVIFNLANNTPNMPIQNENGYLHVSLARGDGTREQHLVHRLVARHWLPNPYDYPQVNHKDGNKLNCHKDNLEWCSAQFNIEHALKTGLRPGYMSANDKELYLQRVLSGEQVNDIAFEISRRPETLHKMLRETAKRLGIHNQWEMQMKENRRNVAIRNIGAYNAGNP